MPTYEYVCSACAHHVEYFQPMSEAPKKKCPECKKSKLVRQIGAGAGILFKGSGFYQTDYRSDSYKKAQSADKPAADCGGDAKSCAANGGPCADSASASTASAKDKSATDTGARGGDSSSGKDTKQPGRESKKKSK
mgnify:CR=1 FL=1